MFTPDTYKLTYSIDEVKKTFTQFKIESADLPLLTDIIRLEKNNGYNSITGADNLLVIRNATNWTKCNRAGLRPTETPNFYYSDLPVNDAKSLIVVFISDDVETIIIRVCKQFYPKDNPNYRKRLVNHIIKNF